MLHRFRRLSCMYALRASASAADVRLERKLRYDYAKSKARGQVGVAHHSRYAPVTKHSSAAAAPRVASLRQALAFDSSTPTLIGGKRQRSHGDSDPDVQRRRRCRGNPAEGESQISMSSRTLDTRAISPHTGFDRGDDASQAVVSHGTGGSLAHRATPVEAGVSAQAHGELVQEVKSLRETLAQTQSTLDAVLTRLRVVERHQPRMEGQLDLLKRMQQLAATPTPLAQVSPHSRGSDSDTA